MVNVECSMLNERRRCPAAAEMPISSSTFNIQHSPLNIQHSFSSDRPLATTLPNPATLSPLAFSTREGRTHKDLGVQDHQRPVGELLDGSAARRGVEPARG